MTPQTALLLAGYNRWMNERMYAAAATLDHAALVADRQAFFGSILGTLNHLAVADTIWLHRFARHEPSFAALAAMSGFPLPSSLTQPLAADLAGLREYRQALDAVIERWAAQVEPAHLAADIRWTSMAGSVSVKNFGAVLQHFFNHQAHHRGQVSTLLFQAGVDVGVTDLLAVIPRSDT